MKSNYFKGFTLFNTSKKKSKNSILSDVETMNDAKENMTKESEMPIATHAVFKRSAGSMTCDEFAKACGIVVLEEENEDLVDDLTSECSDPNALTSTSSNFYNTTSNLSFSNTDTQLSPRRRRPSLGSILNADIFVPPNNSIPSSNNSSILLDQNEISTIPEQVDVLPISEQTDVTSNKSFTQRLFSRKTDATLAVSNDQQQLETVVEKKGRFLVTNLNKSALSKRKFSIINYLPSSSFENTNGFQKPLSSETDTFNLNREKLKYRKVPIIKINSKDVFW
ncbi:hypothetical protein HDU92_005167 [Lobulomyces angularis]|nr:hypothetical protein HDU92_005167 [Lobulomyces angularis]